MSDPVARLNAALSGRCAIERELGEGGMATIYLADDRHHERSVRVWTVEGAGHLCLVDRPEYVAEAMLDFITEHRGLVALSKPYTGGLVEE